jgi:hypothetical protein
VNTHHLVIGADPMGLGAARQLKLKGCHALALAGWANLWLYEMTAPQFNRFWIVIYNGTSQCLPH